MQMYFKNPEKFKEDHPEKAKKLASDFKAGRIKKSDGRYKLASKLNESLDVDIIDELEASKKINQDGMALNEDGHSDVPSAVRAMKTIIEDAGQMLQALEQMGEGSLPTWWTNKMAVSASMMNKMRDYLLYPKNMEEGFGEGEPAKDELSKKRNIELEQLTNEGHGLEQKDIDYLSKVIDKSDDKELKKILRFIKKSNIKVDKTKDLSKEKKKK